MSRRPSFLRSLVLGRSNHHQARRAARKRSKLFRIETLEARQMFDGAPDDLAPLSDEFDNAVSIEQWSEIHHIEGWGPRGAQLNEWSVNAAGSGQMRMQPHSVVWYEDWRGPLVFKEVTGDFVVTTRMQIADRDDIGGSDADSIPGDAQFSLGGLMVRTPRPIANGAADWQPGSHSDSGNVGENYIFLSMGYTAGSNNFSFEVKTTRNSTSNLELSPLGQTPNEVELRIARIGSAVIVLHRLAGEANWTVHRRYSRPDLPQTLQVGMVTYTDWEKANDLPPVVHNASVLAPGQVADPSPWQPFNPDLTASFDYTRFARPQLPAELANVDLVNAATDEQLLGFLGDATTPDPDPDPDPSPESPPTRVGMNLSGLTDWDPAWVFKDAFNRARPWGTQARDIETGDTTWQFNLGEGPTLQVDEHGWVTSLPAWQHSNGTLYQQQATTVLFTDEARQPAGIYRAEWDGNGELEMPFVIESGVTPAGRHYALVEMPAGAHFAMTLHSTDPANPVRNINFWMPDYNGQSLVGDWQPGDAGTPFHPLFLERLDGFDTLRFMDWMHTNQTDVVTWSDRARLDDASQSDGDLPQFFHTNGVAPEYMVELANELDANPWFNMPHQADDDFVQHFAELVRDTLEPERTIYVEWSNELWNGFFPTYHWLVQQTTLPENAGLDFFQIAGREIRRDFDIWSDVFAGQEDRIVRVVAGQQANVWLTEQILANVDGRVDAVSSTAYAGLGYEMAAGYDATTTAEDMLDDLENVSIPWASARLQEHRQLVEQYEQSLGRDLQFVTYESGSHVFGDPNPFPNSPALDAALEAAASPRMYDIYQTLLAIVHDAGVDLYNEFTFTSHSGARSFGTYGVLHDMTTPLDEAHKLRALLDFAADQQPEHEPLVAVELSVVDAAGQPLTTVEVGQTFYVVATVDDLRPEGDGVFAAYLDIEFPAELAAISGPLTFAASYPNTQEGATSIAGLIDEAGAIAGLEPFGGDPRELFRLPLVATQTGQLAFTSNAADLAVIHDVLLFGSYDVVPLDAIEFGAVQVVVVEPLVASDDEFAVPEDSAATELDVLANDTLGPTATITAVTQPAHGTVAIAADGLSVSYTPAANFHGSDSFSYEIQNDGGDSATAVVYLAVSSVNDPPIAVADDFTRFNSGAAMNLDVLANDSTGPDTGESLSIAAVAQPATGGSVAIVGNHIVFTPAAGFFGNATFNYTIADGNGGQANAAVTLHVHKQWHNGANAFDANGDGPLSAIDALHGINYLNEFGSGALPLVPSAAQARAGMIDANNDGSISPLDVLLVVQQLHQEAVARAAAAQGAGGEGEGDDEPWRPGNDVLAEVLDDIASDVRRARRARQVR